jgi:hypothetical protein
VPLVIQPQESNASTMNPEGGGRRRLQLARAEANITDPVSKVVGLILGSPDFQRQ